MPRYVFIDMFGKVGVGKSTIFNLFAGKRFLQEGGNLSYDFRTYFARCWVLQRRWEHSMVFLSDPKYELRWNQLEIKKLRKWFEPTNILLIVSDSTPEDIEAIRNSFSIFPTIKRKLIIFIIANMQDLPRRLTEKEVKERLQMQDVLGISAIESGAKEKIEKFMEEAVKRYFLMLAKRGQAMQLLEADEIGFGNKVKEKTKKSSKYRERLKKVLAARDPESFVDKDNP